MERRIRTRLTAREGRSFAFPVGAAFLALASILLWRDRIVAVQILSGIGGLLLLAGFWIPTRLGPVLRAWMGLARSISTVTTPIFMGLVYYLVMTPIGLVRRTVGSNPVRHRSVEGSYWQARELGKRRSNLERQF